MGEYICEKDKKPEKKEGCTVYVTVYCCGDKKKEPPKATIGGYEEGFGCEKPAPVPKCPEGCTVYVNVFCCDEKKKD